MKINRLVSAIFFFVVGLFSLASLQAQEAKTLFVNIPDSLTPLLTKVNREDCIDFLESKMKAQVENRFGKKSEMTELWYGLCPYANVSANILADEGVGTERYDESGMSGLYCLCSGM